MTSVLLTNSSILFGGWFGLDGHSSPLYIYTDGWWGWQDCVTNNFTSSAVATSNAFTSSYVAGGSFTSSAPVGGSDTFTSSDPSCEPWIIR